jgi:hypothetical protein
MTRLIIITSFLLLFSCGKTVEDNSDDVRQEEENYDGTYSALLLPVNGKISKYVTGEVKITKYGDTFRVDVHLKNAPSGTHKQYLQTGSACPQNEDDYNHDGYIDIYETQESMGYRIVPFDGDLSSQSAGSTYFPSGNYHYTRSTSYYLMLSDLHLPDDVVNDHLIKLSEWDLPLERRVVAVYSKVSGSDFPLACGILTKISDREPPPEDSWEEEPQPRTPRDRPRPRPRPRPQPDPQVEPEPNPGHSGGSWWDRIRQRWRRWRDRNDDTVNDDQHDSQ